MMENVFPNTETQNCYGNSMTVLHKGNKFHHHSIMQRISLRDSTLVLIFEAYLFERNQLGSSPISHQVNFRILIINDRIATT